MIVPLLDHDGNQLARSSISRDQFAAQCGREFAAQCGRNGMLYPTVRAAGAPVILGEEGRLAYRCKTLECLVHDERGTPLFCNVYDLDGYGRIKGVSSRDP